MPEKEGSPESAEQVHCSSCGATIAPGDVSEGRARQVGDKTLCASCLELQAKTQAVRCKECGQVEPPLFDGKRYLCRNCGAVIKEEMRAAGGKAPARLCPYCNEPVKPGAWRCPSCGRRLIGSLGRAMPAGLKNYLIGAGATVAVFVVAILITSGNGVAPESPGPPEQGPPSGSAPADLESKMMHAVELKLSIQRQDLDRHAEDLKKAVVQAIAIRTRSLEQRLDALERKVAAAPTETTRPLADILEAIKNAEQAQQPPPETVTVTEKPPEKIETIDYQEVIKEAPAAGQHTEETTKIGEDKAKENEKLVAELKTRANKLAAESKFAEALAVLNSRPDIRDPIWQADREKAKQAIRKRVEELYRLDIARAERMVRNGRYEEAAQTYKLITEYGLPDMIRAAEKRMAEVEDMPEGTAEVEPETSVVRVRAPVPALDSDDPRVRQYVAQLRDKDAAMHVRTRAAKELGALRAKAAVEDLISAMDDRDWYLRVRAANSLEQIGELRAVPALIKNLAHPMRPVSATAHKALVTLTEEDFGKDAQKWEEWWKTEGIKGLTQADREKVEQPDTGEAIEVAPPAGSFASQVVIFKEGERAVTFTIEANSGLKKGLQINFKRDGVKVASAEITVIGFGIATARIVELAEGAALKAGDMLTVEK